MRILAIIPARGGSKGVPGKNIKLLGKKPLIQYSLTAAKNSNCFKRIIVSTEDKNIASIATSIGADVPFLRPESLATDSSPTLDTIIFCLESLKKTGETYDAVCLLQPTSPFRSVNLIKKSIDKFTSEEFDSLISVRKVPHEFNPHWVFKKNENGHLKISTGEEKIISRRQDLPAAYYRDGAIYITRTQTILNHKSLYGEKIGFVESLDEPFINIDTISDWQEAEKLLNAVK